MLRSQKTDDRAAEGRETRDPGDGRPTPEGPAGAVAEDRLGGQGHWIEEETHYPILQGIGRVFVTVGLLVLSFLGYQLWGTGAVTGQSQQALASELEQLESTDAPTTANPPETGEPIGKIVIPKIGVDKVMVEGVDDETLKKGPGHYPETAFPGEAGNVVISGHRTTYGSPFYRLDELTPGDEIIVQDTAGTPHKYKVTEKKIVLPTDLSVVVPSTDARLTLTTCHPRFSAKQRLIIVAALEGPAR